MNKIIRRPRVGVKPTRLADDSFIQSNKFYYKDETDRENAEIEGRDINVIAVEKISEESWTRKQPLLLNQPIRLGEKNEMVLDDSVFYKDGEFEEYNKLFYMFFPDEFLTTSVEEMMTNGKWKWVMPDQQ